MSGKHIPSLFTTLYQYLVGDRKRERGRCISKLQQIAFNGVLSSIFEMKNDIHTPGLTGSSGTVPSTGTPYSLANLDTPPLEKSGQHSCQRRVDIIHTLAVIIYIIIYLTTGALKTTHVFYYAHYFQFHFTAEINLLSYGCQSHFLHVSTTSKPGISNPYSTVMEYMYLKRTYIQMKLKSCHFT